MAVLISLRRAISKTAAAATTTSPISTASSTLISKALNLKPPSPMFATFCRKNHHSFSSLDSDVDDDSDKKMDPKKEWFFISGKCGTYHGGRFPVRKGVSDQMGHPFGDEKCAGLYEIKSIEEGLFVRMDFPGIGKDDVKFSFENNELIVKGEGEKQSEHDSDGRSYGVSLHLGSPECYSTNAIDAHMKNGVLRILIPRIVKDCV